MVEMETLVTFRRFVMTITSGTIITLYTHKVKGCTLCNHHFQLTTPFRFLFFKKLLKMKPFSCEAGYCFFLRPSSALFLLCFYVAFPGTPLRRDNVKPFAAVSEIFLY